MDVRSRMAAGLDGCEWMYEAGWLPGWMGVNGCTKPDGCRGG